MKRLHLFEIEDQKWCPKIIREIVTDFLLQLYQLLGIFEPAYQKIAEVLQKTGVTTIVDCCSGSGGPVIQLRKYLDSQELQSIKITLTDKYPNLEQFRFLENTYPGLKGHKESVDATKLPSLLHGVRSFFSSFHHFAPKHAINILQDAANNNVPIVIFESTERHVIDFIRAFLSPILMWLFMPFAKTITLKKFFFIYILPIAPFVFMWDYLVSNIRTYSPTQFRALIKEVDAPNYHWDIGRLRSKKAKSSILYVVGYSLTTSHSPQKM